MTPPHHLLLFPSRHLYLLQHLPLHHLTLFQNHLSHVSSVVVLKNPPSFPLVLPPWPVLTSPLLMILIILLISHLLFLMSYRLDPDIIFEIIALFVLQTSMVLLM
jgi:hypothetical protein